MGVQSPTGFESLRDDKNVQNHWARRLIAYIIDVALVTVALTIIAIVVSIPFLIGIGFPAVTTFPAVWAAWWGLWFGGPISLVLFLYRFLFVCSLSPYSAESSAILQPNWSSIAKSDIGGKD